MILCASTLLAAATLACPPMPADAAPASAPAVASPDTHDVTPASPAPATANNVPEVWRTLADCESGDWDADRNPIPGTARWDYGVTFAHERFEQYQGGLNFHPDTWDAFRDPGMPDHAGHASRAQQITVGERVQAAQGWGAWPVCSRKIGVRP